MYLVWCEDMSITKKLKQKLIAIIHPQVGIAFIRVTELYTLYIQTPVHNVSCTLITVEKQITAL